MLYSQLHVLHSLHDFLQEAHSANWEETGPGILNQEVEQVKKKWKALKSEYQEKVKEVEEMIPQLLERIQLIQEKKTQLEETLQRYNTQKALAEEKAEEKRQHLQEVFQKQQLVLQKCQVQLKQLKDAVQKLEQSADCWNQIVNRNWTLAGLMNTLQRVSMVSVAEKELVLDINVSEKIEIPPLRVNLRWTSEGAFQVETEGSLPRLPPELQRWPTSHITPTILELQCWFQCNARLMNELKELQKRFAIDWLPIERQLLFSKGNNQHRLAIALGYPMSGGVRLLSVKTGEPSHVSDNIKPPGENPSLSDWLEYLHRSPDFST
ncbi:outer kinetochore KNL1 complex subunit ZWINT isoform X2 [Rhinoderma darwinii]